MDDRYMTITRHLEHLEKHYQQRIEDEHVQMSLCEKRIKDHEEKLRIVREKLSKR